MSSNQQTLLSDHIPAGALQVSEVTSRGLVPLSPSVSHRAKAYEIKMPGPALEHPPSTTMNVGPTSIPLPPRQVKGRLPRALLKLEGALSHRRALRVSPAFRPLEAKPQRMTKISDPRVDWAPAAYVPQPQLAPARHLRSRNELRKLVRTERDKLPNMSPKVSAGKAAVRAHRPLPTSYMQGFSGLRSGQGPSTGPR